MLSCLACASEGKDGAAGPAGAEGKDGIDGSDGRDGADGKDGRDGGLANVIECIAGDYDSDSDGRRNFSIECYSKGRRKVRINYLENGITKDKEYTYYESNGNQKTEIYYFSAGSKFYHNSCYKEDGSTYESCTLEKHGCDLHYSCADLTLYGGGKTDCIAGDYDPNKDTKINFSITCHNSGARKTYITYDTRGTKKSEYTYYENGNLKTRIEYSDYPDCYEGDGETRESCTQAKHGCDENSKTCIN